MFCQAQALCGRFSPKGIYFSTIQFPQRGIGLHSRFFVDLTLPYFLQVRR